MVNLRIAIPLPSALGRYSRPVTSPALGVRTSIDFAVVRMRLDRFARAQPTGKPRYCIGRVDVGFACAVEDGVGPHGRDPLPSCANRSCRRLLRPDALGDLQIVEFYAIVGIVGTGRDCQCQRHRSPPRFARMLTTWSILSG